MLRLTQDILYHNFKSLPLSLNRGMEAIDKFSGSVMIISGVSVLIH